MRINNLHDLFVHELKDVYSAEKQIAKALPKMVKGASSEQLKAAFEEHLEQTKSQISRLEEIFAMLDAGTRGAKCAAMEGIIEEGASMLEEDAEPAALDAALIGAAQKVEHYEIATYGTLRTWARQLNLKEAEATLHEILEEEKATDQKLTELAESQVNVQAEQA